MASKSVTRAITGNNGSYSRILGNFRGVDLTSDPSQVAPDRMAYSVNMWRDYESENGGAIETIPGFRKLFSLGGVSTDDNGKKTPFGRIHGIFAFGKDYIVVHSGTSLYRLPKDYFPSNKENDDSDDAVTEGSGSISDLFGPKSDNSNVTSGSETGFEKYKLEGTMNEADSSAFEYNDKLYILDGVDYRYITADSEDKTVHSVANSDTAYIPTSYYNYKPYEQRNMLQKCFINKKTFLREVPVNTRLITLNAYFELENDGKKKKITKSKYSGGKLYLPGTISLFGSMDYDDEGNEIITGSFVNSDIEQVVIDANVGEIPSYSFANCKKLKRVVVIGNANYTGAPVLKINHNAFYGCPNLTDLWCVNGAVSLNAGDPISSYKKELDWCEYRNTGEEVDLSDYSAYSHEIVPIDGESGLGKVAIGEDKWKIIATKPYAFSLIRCSYGNDEYDKYIAVIIHDEKIGENNIIEVLNTNYEGELWWYNFTIMDPCRSINKIVVNGTKIDEYVENKETLEDGGTEYVTSVDILLPRSYTEEDVEIYGEGELNNFATVKDMADIYQSTTLDKNKTTVEAIGGCTVSCAFDGRVFFTGNKELPNTVFYTHRDLTGANNPTYIGVYNYINDGVGSIPNVAMIASSSMLMVFKQDTTLEGSVFYHTGQDNADTTFQDLIPRIYPSVQGVAGIGCLGAACNFADDAVFISKKGLEAIGKEQVNLERTIQHRSGRIDASLWHTIGKDTKLAEWKGYLVVLTSGGRMYLADSRSLALMRSTGEYQYEWFFLDGIGTYTDDKPVYTYVDTDVAYLNDGTNIFGITELDISKAKETDILINEEVKSVTYNGETVYFEQKSDGRKLLVEKTAERTGGTFSPACAVMEHDGDLYFGCKNGDVCVFNTDKRGKPYKNPYSALEEEEDDIKVDITEIHPTWYNRCGHRYISGFSTLADNCGYPHFNKSTCGKTLTIKAKNMRNSAFSLRARTNREDWKDIERYVSARHDLSYLDFANANFQTQEQQIFSSREKMKKWAEKQLYFFSDGFCEPFGIYNLAYVFEIVGKVK